MCPHLANSSTALWFSVPEAEPRLRTVLAIGSMAALLTAVVVGSASSPRR
ncbi:hypothetical protein [Plantactinospora sp. GCM10030261]